MVVFIFKRASWYRNGGYGCSVLILWRHNHYYILINIILAKQYPLLLFTDKPAAPTMIVTSDANCEAAEVRTNVIYW